MPVPGQEGNPQGRRLLQTFAVQGLQDVQKVFDRAKGLQA